MNKSDLLEIREKIINEMTIRIGAMLVAGVSILSILIGLFHR